ncbi:hypothetical protein Tco_1157630, partial [Tanacetum coccineum]
VVEVMATANGYTIDDAIDRLNKLLRRETHASASVKEIDNVQLGIVSQTELELQPRVLLQFLYRCIH